MAAAASPELPGTSTPMFYCHKCRHQWRKPDESEFVCPNCNDGFIEEVPNVTLNVPRQMQRSERWGNFLTRLVEQYRPTRSVGVEGPEGITTRRARSRSPRLANRRMLLQIERIPVELNISGSSSSSSSSPSPPLPAQHQTSPPSDEAQISPPRPRRAYLEPPFSLDDVMGQFLYNCPLPVSQARLDNLPVVAITEAHSETQCSICFDEFKASDHSVRQLTCNHLYHEQCIFPWLRINGTCPVCRASLDNLSEPNGVLSPRTMRQRNFDSLIRLMRLRNVQGHRTDNTTAAARNERGGHLVGSGNPDLNPEALNSGFLERRRRFRLADQSLERARFRSALRARSASYSSGRPLAGRIESLVNHIHDRAFVAREIRDFRPPVVATVDLTQEPDEVPTVQPNPINIEDFQFAGLSPFNFSTTSESSMSSGSDTASFDSDEELVPVPPLTPTEPAASLSQEAASSNSDEDAIIPYIPQFSEE